MDYYKKYNNIIGWILFGIALLVYMLTIEPTASFWDASERIATAYKLQIPHPPGAPLLQMMQRIFSLLSFGDVTIVAFWINTMSAVVSAATVMLLFWIITGIGKRIMTLNYEFNNSRMWAVFASGIVGALALTFSDTFWFNATEAEAYATSIFFTALAFWAILKWEARADKADNQKWMVFIAYIVGLSIGVHLLSLLTIPAIVFVYYFKKYKPTRKGIAITAILAFLLLGFIQGVLIPGILTVDWWFEFFFVNTIGLPFHSGTLIFFIVLISLIAYGLYYTHKKNRVLWNTVILCFTFIVIGYSSFLMLVIRSNAKPPINENAPVNAVELKSYLGREQYGDWPKVYGQYYNAPIVDLEDGRPKYGKDEEAGKYTVTNPRTATEPVYDPDFMTVFPRMWSNQQRHIHGYEQWGQVEGRPVNVTRRDGSTDVINKPTFTENLRFFLNYQLGHMYGRYFMWNFAGRQNDVQSHGSPLKGNWMSGIPFIDEIRLGDQSILPESITSNPAHNKFYMLPLILGLIGLIYHWKMHKKDTLVIALLFFMTGIAIILYLNQTPFQPRERDYSYAGSFFAFSIWIGIGTLGLIDVLSRKINIKVAIATVTTICLLLVPGIMAKEGWSNHDRSNRTSTLDVAKNYLKACEPNAVLFTMGDNDTFPLWYAQEVEGIRTDIKIINLSLFNTDWYIDYMARRKFYDAKPLPLSLKPEQYVEGTRDYLHIVENPNIEGYWDIGKLVEFATLDNPQAMIRTQRGHENYIPTNKFKIPVDSAKVVENNTVQPEDADQIVDAVKWKFEKPGIQKNQLMLMDFLSQNNWERPVYFAITTGSEAYMGLEDYFQLEGMVYRLVPIYTPEEDFIQGRVNTSILYDNLMNKFEWGNIADPDLYLNEDHRRITLNYRNIFTSLADQLIEENKPDSAVAVLDRVVEKLPEENVPYELSNLFIGEVYYAAGELLKDNAKQAGVYTDQGNEEFEKGNAILERLLDLNDQNLNYYFSFTGRNANLIEREKGQALGIIQRIEHIARNYQQNELAEKAERVFSNYYDRYTMGF